LYIEVPVELRFDAHTHRGEVLDVDELVSLRPVRVAGGLDQLQPEQRGHAPRLELHAAPIRGWEVQGDVEVRDIGLGAEVERPSPRLDHRRVLAEQGLDVEAGAALRGVIRLVEHDAERVQGKPVLQTIVEPPHDDRIPGAVPGVDVRRLGPAAELERWRRLRGQRCRHEQQAG